MVGDKQKVTAARLSRNGKKGVDLALARLVAAYRIGHLDELNYLSVLHTAEIYVVRLVFVLVYLRIVVSPSSQQLKVDDVKYDINAGSVTYSFSLRMRSAGFVEYLRTSETRYDSTRYPM